MAIALGSQSSVAAGGNNLTFNAGAPDTNIAGAAVLVAQNATGDKISGITCNSVAMTRVSALDHVNGSEDGRLEVWWIPVSDFTPGALVEFVLTSTTFTARRVIGVQMTTDDGADIDVVATAGTLDSAATATPSASVTFPASTDGLALGVLHSGCQDISEISVTTGTEIVEADFGNQTAAWAYADSAGGAQSIAWAQTSGEEAGALVVGFVKASTGVSGTVAVTLDNATSTASGGTGPSGTLAETLDATTPAASGSTVAGSVAATLADVSPSIAAGTGPSGTTAVTLDDSTATGSGTSDPPGASGAVAVTLDPTTSTASGSTVSGTLVVTLADTGSAATGTAAPPGVAGSVAATLADSTADAAGTVTPPTASGSLTVALDPVTMSGAGTTVTGTLVVTLDGTTSSGAGATGAGGTAAITTAEVTPAATAGTGPAGSLAETLADTTASATGTVSGDATTHRPPFTATTTTTTRAAVTTTVRRTALTEVTRP